MLTPARTLALASVAFAAAATFAHPASAACDFPQETIPSCLEPVIDKWRTLCVPPTPDVYGC